MQLFMDLLQLEARRDRVQEVGIGQVILGCCYLASSTGPLLDRFEDVNLLTRGQDYP